MSKILRRLRHAYEPGRLLASNCAGCAMRGVGSAPARLRASVVCLRRLRHAYARSSMFFIFFFSYLRTHTLIRFPILYTRTWRNWRTRTAGLYFTGAPV